MIEVNEKSSLILVVDFYDEDEAAVVPTTATYRIDDEENETEILATTNISPLAAEINIEITPAQNAIIDQNHGWEIRTVTVYFTYGVGKASYEIYQYKVKNLYAVS